MVLGDNLHGEVVLLDLDIGMVAHSLHQSALDLCARIVGMMQDTELRVSAFSVQVEVAILLFVEVDAPVHELSDLLRSVSDHLLHCFAVADIVACYQGVGNMLVEVVHLHIGHRGDTALGK